VPHEPGTAAPPGTAGPAGAAGLAGVAGPGRVRSALPGAVGPAQCHVLTPEHFLPHVHNLDERD
jgi:hypothetical protein